MLRIFLPPNLAASAARDAIPVKIEVGLKDAPPPEVLPALALITKWLGAERPPEAKNGAPQRIFLQLSRGQARDLVKALEGRPTFFWANRPDVAIGWTGVGLEGMGSALDEPVGAATAKRVEVDALHLRKKATSAGQPMTVDGSEHFLAVTLPTREHPSYAAVLTMLKNHGFLAEPSNGKWWLRDRHRVLNLLASEAARWRGEFGARFTSNFEKNTVQLKPAEIVCETTEAGGEYEVTVGLKAGAADEGAIRAALMTGRNYVENGDEIILLDEARLKRLAQAQAVLSGEQEPAVSAVRSRRLSAAAAIGVESALEELLPGFQPPATWRARSEALHNLSQLEPVPTQPTLSQLLRPYQKLGAAWLWHLYRNRLGGILADEMGLGKTLQALALISARPAGRPSLVVCPASLLENWRREAARFTPQLRVFVHHAEKRLANAAAAAPWDLVVTSYGTLVRDDDLFTSIAFDCVVADEAQHIKNRRSQNARSLRSLRANGRFVLTGTPVENSLDDLRSLFDFILPGYVSPLPSGLRGQDRAWHDRRLRDQAAPFILRRTKAAVATELPTKLEQVLWCELSPTQAALYRSYQEKAERELDALVGGGASEAQMRLAAFTQLLRLRQICCDPRLLDPAGASADDSAKLEAFRELLDEAVDDGHRLLVFSQFTSLLALLKEELVAQGMEHCYLDGSMPTKARQAEVDRFQGSPDIPVFLLSLKAGGTGLNLTGADTVVHFDPWWNPAVEMQATDRAHRIGQTRVVTSYKLIASGTVEEKVLGLQAAKRTLLADVFEASDAASASLSLAELQDLLR